MKCTFNLRNRNAKNETLILFVSYFNEEKKTFRYSTKQSVIPSHWNFNTKAPYDSGKNKAYNHAQVSKKLRKFKDAFDKVKAQCELADAPFNSVVLKDYFDREFNRVKRVSSFFEVYDKFTEENIKLKIWKKSTITRYSNIKNLLLEFEKVKKYRLTFNKINKTFYVEFTDFCMEYKDHYTNTFSRNMGLVKTFLFWAERNDYSFQSDFKSFKKPTRVLTREEAFDLNQLDQIDKHQLKDPKLNERKDVFILQALTGMRYGELSLVNKRTVKVDKFIQLKEVKSTSKPTRMIPLSFRAVEILQKYDYNLPLVSNQKQNEAIKRIVRLVGFDHEVEYTRTKGVEQKLFIVPFYQRIYTHTARRSFITIMRNKGVSDKTIMSITGHTDLKTFSAYHQVNDFARFDAVNDVFRDM